MTTNLHAYVLFVRLLAVVLVNLFHEEADALLALFFFRHAFMLITATPIDKIPPRNKNTVLTFARWHRLTRSEFDQKLHHQTRPLAFHSHPPLMSRLYHVSGLLGLLQSAMLRSTAYVFWLSVTNDRFNFGRSETHNSASEQKYCRQYIHAQHDKSSQRTDDRSDFADESVKTCECASKGCEDGGRWYALAVLPSHCTDGEG